MTVLSDQINEFRTKFRLHVASHPNLAPDESMRLHHRLITEEVSELFTAIQERDPVEVLDALGDIVYLAYGAAADCGYDLDAALHEIHASNMRKLVDGRVIYRPDGKVLKPEGWAGPNLTPFVEGKA